MKDGDISTMLELAAKATGITRRSWNPLNSSGDCAEMCLALGINVRFVYQHCNIFAVDCACLKPWIDRVREEVADYNNDRSAAWRMAALRVAAEIGRETE